MKCRISETLCLHHLAWSQQQRAGRLCTRTRARAHVPQFSYPARLASTSVCNIKPNSARCSKLKLSLMKKFQYPVP